MLAGPAVAQTSGPLFLDYRGATGGCCYNSNGADGEPGQIDVERTLTGLNILSTGGATGVAVDVSGGNGGNGDDVSGRDHWGGSGGFGRIVDFVLAQSTVVSNGFGVSVLSKGGDGGLWGNRGHGNGNGGNGNFARLTLDGGSVSAVGYGLSAQSIGGNGQTSAIPWGAGVNAGVGGNAGDASVVVRGGAVVTASASGGNGGAAIRAESLGGQGGLGIDDWEGGYVLSGWGGNAGNVTVSIADGTVTAHGDGEVGVLARSVGGNGPKRMSDSTDVKGSNGGNAGNVTLTNGAAITTDGANAPGIAAYSLGGDGGDGGGGVTGNGFQGGDGGTPGSVTVTNTGSVVTRGVGAMGIRVAVIGGAGGNGGESGPWSGHGGNGGSGGNTGSLAVDIKNDGTIMTTGNDAVGILAHAVGGGAGGAELSQGIMNIGGGSGGNGGLGGNISVGSNGSIFTTGDQSPGVQAQSIGGGGGHGGDADTTGIIVGIATGGHGGAGGNGGNAVMDLGGAISTAGAGSTGILLQSVGGGGGAGGSSRAMTVGVGLGVAVSHGGSAGGGGAGGLAHLTLEDGSSITTQAAASDGAVVQSVGGGGGYGGLASSATLTIAPDLGPEVPAATLSPHVSIGGSGGDGGGGGIAQVDNSGGIWTQGDKSIGILAQSIGGGGGAGGSAAAALRAQSIAAPNSRFNISVGATIGGAGGGGGDGATALVTNNIDGSVLTTGDHSSGIVAQSIGGGGGVGGMVQQETAKSFGATLGAPGSAQGLLQTMGNWLTRSGNSMNVAFGSLTIGVDVRVGGTGGQGGAGNAATVNNYGRVTTSGGGSAAIVAQSIGGGGGQGGTAASTSVSSLLSSLDSLLGVMAGKVGTYFNVSPNVGTNVAVGGSGGWGGDGRQVSVLNTGTLSTNGFGAPGILAQSVGGGGGTGAATSQNLELFLSNWAPKDAPGIINEVTRIIDLLGSNLASAQHSVNVSVGGRGGGAGSGGLVNVDASDPASRIQTRGDSSPGILAQSISGGGGQAAATDYTFGASSLGAAAGSTSPALSLFLGGAYTGNLAGNAGQFAHVNVKSGGVIATQGVDSSGVVAQSITGGGGAAAVGLTGNASTHLAAGQQVVVPVITLGSTLSGALSPSSMNGAPVSVVSSGSVYTSGVLSHGILAQSVAGGGGAAGMTVDAQVASLLGGAVVKLGASPAGGSSLQANAGSVSVDLTNLAVTQAVLSTQGALSFGVLAQSIGGGGGYVALVQGGNPFALPVTSLTLGAQGDTFGSGADVNVNVARNVAVQTLGQDAHGIVAQSVGGGGGIAGATTAPGRVTLASVNNSVTRSGANDGGTVEVAVDGSIRTRGDGAAGVLAQSVGGGGGIAGDAAAVTYGLDMVRQANVSGAVGAGGTVQVSTSGSVVTYGANAPAILAMSLGGGAVFSDGGVWLKQPASASGNAGGAIDVTLQPGSVVGAMGAGSPAIAAISMGNAGAGSMQGKPIGVTIGKGASVMANATSGIGILAINTDGVNVENAGTVSAATAIVSMSKASVANSGVMQGNVQLTTDSTFLNRVGGELRTARLLSAGLTQNYGTVSPGGPGVFQASQVYGDFRQTGTGVYAPDLDFTNHNSDFLAVTGALTFGGSVVPILRNPVKNIWLGIGHFDKAPTGETAVAKSTALVFDYRMKDHYGGSQDPLISVDANFRPPGVSLNANQASFADFLQTHWDAGMVEAGPLFQPFVSAGDAASYRKTLDVLSGAATLMRAGSRGHENYDFLNRLMSCPQFVTNGTRMGEGSCVWARVIGTRADRFDTADDVGFRSQQVTYQFGAQKEIAHDWFFGGSASYVVTHARSSDRSLDISSDGFRGGLTLKRQMGPWQIALAVLGGYESGTQNRTIDYPGASARATSRPDAFFVGARSRLSYQLNYAAWYVKPYADLDVVYDRNSAYLESGAGVFNLAMQSEGRTTAVLSPAIEVGARLDYRGVTVRPYLSAGMSFASKGDVSVEASLVQFPGAAFRITSSQPRVYGNFALGVELLSSKGLEVRAEYNLRTAASQTVQSAALRLAKHF
ncbi:outer membrane autotransporter barrel domain-containing protein 8 [Pandoraea horticolens]|uniref:Outer membrane autotransporter barrel domain-containing protein 8 n=1 Tax=Pandoraea horticolens TaxID=2508298 RepID=A0A5E4Y1C9_9BURK|nr:autotransporter outer membrane beta-barrel domain-containing protein [Pandoraea horticolens]VVE42529.1 outer membrane autotransporter barrel domain-containing protein 8 [Pandoraea horticolens]